jgi:hypothetical protein
LSRCLEMEPVVRSSMGVTYYRESDRLPVCESRVFLPPWR